MPRPAITLTFDGKTLTLREWAVLKGISFYTIRTRLKAGKSIADILSPLNMTFTRKPQSWEFPDTGRKHKRITHDGKTMSIPQWANTLGITHGTIYRRLKKGLPIDQVFSPVVARKKKAVSAPKIPRTRRSILTFMGESMPIEEWALDLDIPVSRILARLKAGEPVEACLAREPRFRVSPSRRLARPVAVMHVPTFAELDDMRRAA